MEVLVCMLTSMEEVLSVAGPELLSLERLGQALGALQVCREPEGSLHSAIFLGCVHVTRPLVSWVSWSSSDLSA